MSNSSQRKLQLSKTSTLHYIKLIYRSVLFVSAVITYIYIRLTSNGNVMTVIRSFRPLIIILWLTFAIEMILRLFPSKLESMGCQKQFSGSYLPPDPAKSRADGRQVSAKSVIAIAVFWVLLTTGIGLAYFGRLIDQGIILLICLAFSVCDMICILFFCPFQTWIMKNKCCVSCRIYNWDYAMMFTPMVFINSLYAWSLLGISIILLLRWEITYFRHPERFAETSNASLSCANCKEKLCSHKKSLQTFLRRQKRRTGSL